jgi:phosphonate transport system permease protein
VGAGGIGVVLDDFINFFQRDCVATILLASLIIIIVAEVIVRRLRSRLI